jgi:hypothetical protein
LAIPKKYEKPPHFSFFPLPPVAGKFSTWAKSNTQRYQIIVLKFQENPITTRLRI